MGTSPPLHPNQPLWQDEEAHAVLVLGTKGTVLVSSADDLIPFTSTANFNQEGEKGTSSMGSSTELIRLLKRALAPRACTQPAGTADHQGHSG